MRHVVLAFILAFCGYRASATVSACPVTHSGLSLHVTTPKSAGVSPFLVFFDATGTTTSNTLGGAGTITQDITYTWNFSDGGASGKGVWAYGAKGAYGSKNIGSGIAQAHLYIVPDGQGDTAYTAVVTANDGTTTATCGVSVTAYDASASNGFPTSGTTCISASGTPTAGSGGCPAGANVSHQSNFATAIGSSASNKRLLFKCGDSFTGDNANWSGTKTTIGAYGGCENTQTNRPIFTDSSTNGELSPGNVGDLRIIDIDLEGAGSGAWAIETQGGTITYQVTMYNLYSNGNSASYAFSQGAQWGLIGSVQNGASGIGTFFNYGSNNPPYSGNTFNNLDYSAIIGNHITGRGPGGSGGIETIRISACRMCVVASNTVQDANSVGADLKFQEGNTSNSCGIGHCGYPCTVGTTFATTTCWVGIYDEYVEISDNLFTGNTGGQMVEISPENSGDDERMRNIVFERNLLTTTTGAPDGRQLLISGVNITARNNVFMGPASVTSGPFAGIQIAQRGIEPVASNVEIYNNTCNFLTGQSSQGCIQFNGIDFNAPGINSFAANNLYFGTATWSAVVNDGTGNTVSNNTTTNTNNPAFTDASGSFNVMTDFKPTANYSSGTSVPNLYDALGTPWVSTWSYGAVHP